MTEPENAVIVFKNGSGFEEYEVELASIAHITELRDDIEEVDLEAAF